MSHSSVAVFCMLGSGHIQRLIPIVAGLRGRGVAVHVFTDRRFAGLVEAVGGTFVDLLSKYPLEHADPDSWPRPCRLVAFAAHYMESILRDLRELGSSLVIYDTFAVVGAFAARLLGLPHVNVCAGHNVDPGRFVRVLEQDPCVRVSAHCLRAVDDLRERYGIEDASPFSYVSTVSPHLNVYCEPPEFLEQSERAPFQPLEFFGSLGSAQRLPACGDDSPFGPGSRGRLKVYVSFGTVVWRYHREKALRALRTVCRWLAAREDIRAVVSLGGVALPPEQMAGLDAPNVRLESHVDQGRVLAEADVFLTHHGMNSTHEAIASQVPMVSHPFFWDQPSLAAKCQRFGVAVPLTAAALEEVRDDHLARAFETVLEQRAVMGANLQRALGWEEGVIARRPAVFDRILGLY